MSPRPSLLASHPALAPLLDRRDGAQRARLLEAMTQVVADKGYAATTVADVVSAARVSRGTFYAEFPSKEACFVEAYRHGIDVLIDRIEAAVRDEAGDWRAKLRAAMRAFLATLAVEPRFARAYLFEVHGAGTGALAARDATLRRFADRYRATFAAAGGPVPSGDALFVLAAGIDQLVRARVLEGGVEDLPKLEDTLVDCALTLGGSRWT